MQNIFICTKAACPSLRGPVSNLLSVRDSAYSVYIVPYPYPYQNIKINKRWMRCTGYFADNWLSNWIRNFTTVTQKIQSVTTTNLETFLKNRTLLDNEISQLNGLVHCGAISARLNTQIYMCNDRQKATG